MKAWMRRPFWLNLFEESALAFWLHTIFQNQHILPGIILGLRAPSDMILPGERTFALASTKKSLEEGDIPVKIRNFSKPQPKKEESK